MSEVSVSPDDDYPARPAPADCPYGLRAIRISEHASEETLRFEAILVAHGQDLAVVTNDGRGGCHLIRAGGGATRADLHDFEQYAEQWGADQTPPVRFEPADALVDELLWRSLTVYE
ncbi:hypothetical protein [Cellulomonas uda]|uniref:Uncharacterized protein n=1 Tax=Cellulomonas uda TaxID=1714 RepID=A0A4Y3KED6_CELUD|nr:hypothetical protein [Cellulomonas uda]NII67846.1 hypothetical protein [Cellulomonas uda]GEA82367.1 hypothetical protein CUD01_28110 [Cellulomonas uda]